MNRILGMETPASHLRSVGLPPFELIDIEKIQIRKGSFEIAYFRQGGNLKPGRESQLPGMADGRNKICFEHMVPAFDRRMQPDLIDKPG
jgi:hypothetical protein